MTRILAAFVLAFVFLAGFFASSNEARTTPVTFHFYGASDCAPCMAFKRSGLPVVNASAKSTGFGVAVNMIDKTVDVPKPGSYGDTDALLRIAEKQLDIVYPPIFFVSKNGQIVSVHRGDWKEALVSAEREAAVRVNH